MKTPLAALVLICAAVAFAAYTKDPASILDREWRPFDPPDHVSRWIGIHWAGAMHHPIIPVFYSVERGERSAGQLGRFVLLTSSEYGRLSGFIHSYRCSSDPIGSRPPYPNTIWLAEFAQGARRDLCFMPRNPGCDFLAHLIALPGIDWARKDNFALTQFEDELACKEPKHN